jgi:hypothetical protein
VRLQRPGDSFDQTREQIDNRLGDLNADGGAHLYRAVIDAARRADAMRGYDLSQGERRLYGMILITASGDTDDTTTVEDLYEALPDGTESDQVRIHVIALGDAVNDPVLQEIATRTNGNFYPATVQSLEETLRLISSEF